MHMYWYIFFFRLCDVVHRRRPVPATRVTPYDTLRSPLTARIGGRVGVQRCSDSCPAAIPILEPATSKMRTRRTLLPPSPGPLDQCGTHEPGRASGYAKKASAAKPEPEPEQPFTAVCRHLCPHGGAVARKCRPEEAPHQLRSESWASAMLGNDPRREGLPLRRGLHRPCS